jgi:hypothetical protein
MIVCTGCGNANETRAEFCGSCGTYLEWHGERIGTDPPPAPPPLPAPPPEKPGLMDRVRYVVGLDETPPGAPTPVPGGPHAGPPYAPPPHAPPPVWSNVGMPTSDAPGGTQRRHADIGPTGAAPAGAPPAGWPPAPGNGPAAPFGFVTPPSAPEPPPGPRQFLPPPPPPAPIGQVAGTATVVPQAPAFPQAPVSPAVGARPPEAEYERPPALRPDPVDLGPADLYCGACGAGNDDDRSYCRRCGAPLAIVFKPERRSWWRRLFRRKSTGLVAGQRPHNWAKFSPETAAVEKPKRTFRFPRRIVLSRFALPLIGLSVLGMGLGPMRAKATEVVFDVYHSAKRKIAPTYVHVTPRQATASDAARNHPASALIDRNTTSYWSDGRPGTAAGSVITVTFDRPIELAKMGVHSGAAGKDFPFQPRPRVVEVTYLERGQEVQRKQLTLVDKPEFQTFDLAAKRVDQATVRVVSVYAGQKGSATSLAELEFLTVQ